MGYGKLKMQSQTKRSSKGIAQGISVQLPNRLHNFFKSQNVIRMANAALLVLVLVPLAATERLPASFSSKVTRVVVEIDGVNYGAFDPIKNLEKGDGVIDGEKGNFHRVILTRHFVTDQSLYKWADDEMRGQSRLKDIVLISENAEGVEVARHLLKHSQPVAAVVEASNPEVGGLHEKIEFAVQSIQPL